MDEWKRNASNVKRQNPSIDSMFTNEWLMDTSESVRLARRKIWQRDMPILSHEKESENTNERDSETLKGRRMSKSMLIVCGRKIGAKQRRVGRSLMQLGQESLYDNLARFVATQSLKDITQTTGNHYKLSGSVLPIIGRNMARK